MEDRIRVAVQLAGSRGTIKALTELAIKESYGINIDLDDGIWRLYADAVKTYFFTTGFLGQLQPSDKDYAAWDKVLRWAGQTIMHIPSELGSSVDPSQIHHDQIKHIANGIITYYFLSDIVLKIEASN